jgi:tetratricopeptide (TPR) repeat protein
VTARSSSHQYKRTTKSPQEIGRELGVEYLLTGTVRWEKDGGGRRVRVSPELIQVSTGSSRWQQPFDAAITDVFRVQADIAERVAQALDLALGSAQQKALAARPTANLAAYDLYLKGVAARSLGANPVSLRDAYRQFDQAVALDSTFVAAWAAMSEAGSLLYAQGSPSAPLADQVRSAAERAQALAPERPEGHRVLGDYYRRVPVDPARALDSYRKGLQLAPSDADVLRGIALAEQSLGQYDAAIEHFRRSLSLDPRASLTAEALGVALTFARRYPEALIALDHALALEPSSVSAAQGKAMVYLAQADLPGARRVLAQPPPGMDLPSFVAYMATYLDLYWPLDEQQQALLRRLSPSAFNDDRAGWGLALAGAHEIRGDMDQARIYADSARIALEQQLKATPEDPQRLVLLGLSLAYLGRREEAIRYAERGTTLMPVSKDAVNGAYFQHQFVRIHILLGQPDKALDKLEPLLAMRYYLSPGWLKIDPTFDPLRQHPRFRKLVEGTS